MPTGDPGPGLNQQLQRKLTPYIYESSLKVVHSFVCDLISYQLVWPCQIGNRLKLRFQKCVDKMMCTAPQPWKG